MVARVEQAKSERERDLEKLGVLKIIAKILKDIQRGNTDQIVEPKLDQDSLDISNIQDETLPQLYKP